MKPFYDLYRLEEDQRIDMIGHNVVDHRKTVAFLVDDDGTHEKGTRYINKLLKKFPLIEVVDRTPGPVANVETIRVRRRADA